MICPFKHGVGQRADVARRLNSGDIYRESQLQNCKTVTKPGAMGMDLACQLL